MKEKTCDIIRLVKLFVAFAAYAAIVFVFIFPGCEGPQGPAGEDIGEFDLQPPEIYLTRPTRSDTVFTDTFTVAATARDNEGVMYVEFFLDGSSSLGAGEAARDSTSPYRVLWDLQASGHGFGFFPLIARAVDNSNNSSDTPPVLIHHLLPTGDRLLSYYSISDANGYMVLPKKYSPAEEKNDRYFNVRFTPEAPCMLKEIWFEFIHPDSIGGFSGGCDIYVTIWESQDRLPTNALDSLHFSENNIAYRDTIGVSRMRVDVTQLNLLFTSDFHAGYSPVDSLYDSYIVQNRVVPIAVTTSDEIFPDDLDHRSIGFEGGADGLEWSTLQQQFEGSLRVDFHIEALVEYSSGQRVLLSAAGSSQSLQNKVSPGN